jgi:hypothetical protein
MTIKHNSSNTECPIKYSGITEIVANGASDIYLSGTPQITFFKVTYRRHTNFSMETTIQPFNETYDIDILVPGNNEVILDNMNNIINIIVSTSWNYNDIFEYLKEYINIIF